MIFFKKPIFTGFSPNMTKQDILTACSFLFLPWKWKELRVGDSVKKVEDWFTSFFSTRYAFAFDSGRSALYFSLRALGVTSDDEVLVQGYTCVVVSNAILWAGAKPIYIDIEDNLNMSLMDLERKITEKTKVLIIQHTFGLPANIDKLIEIARKHNLKVIEDCAHSLGATYNEKLVGTFGDISIFSFGSNKIISCVRGGILITNKEEFANKIKEFRDRLPKTRVIKVFQHLLFYPVFVLFRPVYNLKVGKWALALAKKINILARILYPAEKQAKQVLFYPALFPNALASVLLNQLTNLIGSNKSRGEIVNLYVKYLKSEIKKQPDFEGRIWLYYPILINNPQNILQRAKKQGIILGSDWSGSTIVPRGINLKKTGYQVGACPKAEEIVHKIITLPTNRFIKEKDVKRITKIINEFSVY